MLLGLTSACDNTASRLAAEAESCELAERKGRLDIAEETCQRALGDVGDDVLLPQVRSERLYRLARIKRQRSKYAEAAELLDQSLALEQTLSDFDSPQVASRRLEMSLILAGQGQWQDGARLLEQTVPIANRLNEKERASLINVLQHYSAQLQKSQQLEQASRLQAAAASLKQKK
ncbi:MAG: hypothetical protein BMS9Abin08_1537 [Gammaproteobacteria bacterium]|nr:MAG: hypothetical protein BMS9Abin08_1537 [Gammaproteobacteria bacterium]